jgi:hypothetical protein
MAEEDGVPEPVANVAPAASPLKASKPAIPQATKAEPETKQKGRAGLKHIGAYLDRDVVEQIAILRARLGLDNSALIRRAVEELFQRETAARKFGDR